MQRVMLAVLAVLLCGTANAQEKVTYNMAWLPQGSSIGVIVAINTQWPGGICWVTSRMQPKGIDDLKGRQLGGGSASLIEGKIDLVESKISSRTTS